MNEVMKNPFRFSDHEVRTAIDENGNVWFCAKDVFESLEITWSSRNKSLMNTPDNWICTFYLQGQRGSNDPIFISEPAVYQTAFRSNKPKAVEFVMWVCEEVLPALRRQGFFGRIDAKNRLAYSKQIASMAEKLARNTDAFIHNLLAMEIRNLCNMIGQPVPDISLLGQDYRQLSLPGFEKR